MACCHNRGSSPNGLSRSLRYSTLKTNLWIYFSYLRTGVINPAGSQIKQNRAYGKGGVVGWTEHLFSDVLRIADKQFIVDSWLRNTIINYFFVNRV